MPADRLAMSDSLRLSSEDPLGRVAALAALWQDVAFERFPVDGLSSVNQLLPRSESKCGIYVLSFADGQLYVGQAVNVVRRFPKHKQTYPDITELHFWRFNRDALDNVEKFGIQRLQAAGFLLRNVTHASGRLGASRFDSVVTPQQQDQWLMSIPTDFVGDDPRQERPEQRLRNRTKFDRLVADPRFDDLVPGLRRYVARTIPFPRRTELGSWSVSAVPSTNKDSWPRLLAVTVQALETLIVEAPVDDNTRTMVRINVDLAIILHRWGNLDRLRATFPAAYVREARYNVRPGVLALEVEGTRNLMRLLDLDGVTDSARRLNLDLMRKGPAFQWQHHSYGLADRLLEPVIDELSAPEGDASGSKTRTAFPWSLVRRFRQPAGSSPSRV
jgi:hypothetical protein